MHTLVIVLAVYFIISCLICILCSMVGDVKIEKYSVAAFLLFFAPIVLVAVILHDIIKGKKEKEE